MKNLLMILIPAAIIIAFHITAVILKFEAYINFLQFLGDIFLIMLLWQFSKENSQLIPKT